MPLDLKGVFLRNGPNPVMIPSNNRHHWFDGDSMIHAIRIESGRLFYSNQLCATPKLRIEDQVGRT